MLSFRFFSTLFRPVGKFWYHFGLILAPLGPQKHTIFIERVIKFQLLAIFVVEATLGHETHLKKLQMLCPSTPNGTPEEPRSAQERPGRVPKASQNHPPRALWGPLGVQKASRGGLGSLGASFWTPKGQFYLIRRPLGWACFDPLCFGKLCFPTEASPADPRCKCRLPSACQGKNVTRGLDMLKTPTPRGGVFPLGGSNPFPSASR